MNKKIDRTLSELVIGILIMGIIVQIADILISSGNAAFRHAIPHFALGFWIGIAVAVGLSIHMYRSIDRALDMYTEDAEKYMRKAYLFRTAVILLAAGVVTYFETGYVMAYFLGVLCLKFGAFLQPLIHKCLDKFQKNDE